MANHGLPEDPIGQIKETTKFLLDRITVRPKIAVICGTGFKQVADYIQDLVIIDYTEIPNFNACSVPGHVGQLVFGLLGGASVVFMRGRVHLYEGHSIWESTFPIRVFAELGVKALVVTNASGGINPKYKAGDMMIIKDHINLPGLCGLNPCYGVNDDRLGPRFTCMHGAYDRKFRAAAWKVGRRLKLGNVLREGIYLAQLGPTYETPAELRMIRRMGGDVVGMSTCAEIAVARQCGLRCFGMSLITNVCSLKDDDDESTDEVEEDDVDSVLNCDEITGDCDSGPDHNEVLDVGNKSTEVVQSFMSGLIAEIAPWLHDN